MHTPTPIRRSTRYGKKRSNGARTTTIAVSHFANGIQADICTVASVEYADDIVKAVNSYDAMREALRAYNLIDFVQILGDAATLNEDPRVADLLNRLSSQLRNARDLATPALAEGKE